MEQLQKEFYIVPGKKGFLCVPDNVWAIVAVPGFLTYVRALLLQDQFRGLKWISDWAYNTNNLDYYGIVVSSLGERALFDFVCEIIKVSRAGNASEVLFREDGLDTALLGAWSQTRCKSMLAFLREALEPVLALPDAYELDPSRVRHTSLLPGNACNVEGICDAILNGFAAAQLPPLLQHMIPQLGSVQAIINLIILRVLSPAVLNPQRFGVIDFGLVSAQTRGLLNVAKVLQHVANGVVLDEANHMSRLNPFVSSRSKELHQRLGALQSTLSLPELETTFSEDALHGLVTMVCS